MTINDAITKLRVMLGAEEPVQEVKDEAIVTMSEAELVDGTIVMTEGELVPGAILYVQVAEGDAPFAPEGQMETTDGLIITVGANGEVISIEEKTPAAEPVADQPADAPVAEQMADEVVVEEEVKKEDTAFNAEELLVGVAEILKPYTEKIEALSTELSTLQERFNEVADLPAAAPVKRNFMEDARAQKQVAEARLAKLAQIRRNK